MPFPESAEAFLGEPRAKLTKLEFLKRDSAELDGCIESIRGSAEDFLVIVDELHDALIDLSERCDVVGTEMENVSDAQESLNDREAERLKHSDPDSHSNEKKVEYAEQDLERAESVRDSEVDGLQNDVGSMIIDFIGITEN